MYIIGIGFEGQVLDCDCFIVQVVVKGIVQFVEECGFLMIVDSFYGVQYVCFIVYFMGDVFQCVYVFGEIGVVIVVFGINKVVVDVWIGIDVQVYVFDICVKMFGQIGYFVYKVDFGGQYGVGGIFGEFCGVYVYKDQFVVVLVVRVVVFVYQFMDFIGVCIDYDMSIVGEVFDGGIFFEEFWVGIDVEVEFYVFVGQFGVDGGLNLVSGVYWYGGFVDY